MVVFPYVPVLNYLRVHHWYVWYKVEERVVLRSVLKASTELINDFRGEKIHCWRGRLFQGCGCRGCIRGVLLSFCHSILLDYYFCFRVQWERVKSVTCLSHQGTAQWLLERETPLSYATWCHITSVSPFLSFLKLPIKIKLLLFWFIFVWVLKPEWMCHIYVLVLDEGVLPQSVVH